jgi:hypothetical protein
MGERKLQMNSDHPLSLTLLPCGAVEHKDLEDLAQALRAKGMLVTIATCWSIIAPPRMRT